MTIIEAAAGPANDCADSYQSLRKTLLAIDTVRALSHLRPGRVVWDTFWCWVIILGAWTAVAIHPAWWVVLLAIPVIGPRYYALFIIGHDGIHRRLFPRPGTNDLFNDLFCFGPIGAITRINNRNHLTHHHYVGTLDDPDRHKYSCVNKATHSALLGYLVGATSVFLSVKHVFWDLGNTAARQPDHPGRGTDARYTLRDLMLLLSWQAILFGGLSWAIGWWAYPVLWVLPLAVFFVLADNFRTFAEHSHPESDVESDRHRLITYLSNPVERWFVAPMNMNYHSAHHLWPSIPYYNLPEADRLMRKASQSGVLEWRHSYFGYLFRYWRKLPLAECLPASPADKRMATGSGAHG